MIFTVDDYFHIGQMHLGSGKPCQDYSFSGVTNEGAFVIVSDGCSTGRHTDVGARIIALSTANVLQWWLKNQNIPLSKLAERVMQQYSYAMQKSSEAFNLQLLDMLATCLYGCFTPTGGLVSVQGDGVVAKVYRDGSVILIAYRWENNTPLYPAYMADDFKNFIKAHGDDLSFPALKVEYYHQNDCKGECTNSGSITLDQAIKGITHEIDSTELNELSFLAIFTDGVMQVDGMNWKDVVLQLLAFKNVEGEFAKRRMIRFIKDSRNIGEKKGPLDDISYAVIRVDHEASKEAQCLESRAIYR